jgi:hypothetical protein
MTSLLRRKHQITVPKSRPTTIASDLLEKASLRLANRKLARRLLGWLALAATVPGTLMADSPPSKLNPPANAKAIWVERDATPRSFAASRYSKKPAAEPTVERTEKGAILKWRAKGSSSIPSKVKTASGISSSGHGRVRQAAQLAPLDPFQNPFGDSVAQTDDGGSFQLDPPKTEPTPMKAVAPSDGGPPTPNAPSDTDGGRDENPMAPEAFDQPGERVPAESLPEPSDKYNGRNCADDDENCRLLRDTVNLNTIDKIKLNITPTIEPEAESLEEMDEAKRARLAEMPAR